jgi:hypothetical protein
MRRLEQALQRAVLDHLRWRGVPGLFVFHYPAGGWRTPTEAAILKGLGVTSGVPDLLILHQGKLHALELKSARGRLTTVQAETQHRMRVAGALAATAIGIDEALERLEAWDLLRPNVANHLAKALSEPRHDMAERTKRSVA